MTRNNIIKMIRGDTYEFTFTIEDENGEPYAIKTGDVVYFGLMEYNQPFENPIMHKSTADGGITFDETSLTYFIKIDPEDTLTLLPGVYYYAIKLAMNHESDSNPNTRVTDVQTIVNRTKFIIMD